MSWPVRRVSIGAGVTGVDDPEPILCGYDVASNPVRLSPADRNRHMYVIGASGMGKSYFLQSLLQEDIDQGNGALLIDPHGELFDNVAAYCATRPELARRVILFDPSSCGPYVVGFNPIAPRDYLPDPAVQAEKFIDAVKRVMHQDAETQPQLESTLRNALIPLIAGGQSLLALEHFFNLTDNAALLTLAEQSESSWVRLFWRNFVKLQPREKLATVGSAQRRIEKFLYTEAVRLSLGQTKRMLDIRDIVEGGKVLLVNLGLKGNRLATESAHLLGILLVNAFMDYGRSRDIETAKARPFYLYLDECQHFVTSDVAELLTGGRKFGMSLVLANQELTQIADETVRNAILAARIQVIFGGISPESAETMETVIGVHHDPWQVKYMHEREYFAPKLRRVTTRGRNWSASSGSSNGQQSGRTSGRSERPLIYEQSHVETRQDQAGTSSTFSEQRSEGGSEQEGYVTDHETRTERVPTFMPIEEQRYLLWAMLRGQAERIATMQIGRSSRPVQFRTVDVERPAVSAMERAEFLQRVWWSHGCYVRADMANTVKDNLDVNINGAAISGSPFSIR